MWRDKIIWDLVLITSTKDEKKKQRMKKVIDEINVSKLNIHWVIPKVMGIYYILPFYEV